MLVALSEEDTQRAAWTGHLRMDGCARACLLGLGLSSPARSAAPDAGEYSFTCLSRQSQVMEKRRRDQRGDPPGKGTEGRGGKRDKGKGLGLRSSRTQWG